LIFSKKSGDNSEERPFERLKWGFGGVFWGSGVKRRRAKTARFLALLGGDAGVRALPFFLLNGGRFVLPTQIFSVLPCVLVIVENVRACQDVNALNPKYLLIAA